MDGRFCKLLEASSPKMRVQLKCAAYCRSYASNRKASRWVIFRVFKNGNQKIIAGGSTPTRAWETAVKKLGI